MRTNLIITYLKYFVDIWYSFAQMCLIVFFMFLLKYFIVVVLYFIFVVTLSLTLPVIYYYYEYLLSRIFFYGLNYLYTGMHTDIYAPFSISFLILVYKNRYILLYIIIYVTLINSWMFLVFHDFHYASTYIYIKLSHVHF